MTEDPRPGNRILIAEDDPVSRRVLQIFLQKWKYDVTTATDGLEALRVLDDDKAPSMAILDWMMPGMEGPEVCRRVRQNVNRPYIYILLLTARSLKEDLLRGLELGADDYLTKPLDAPELRARLKVGQRILDLQENLISAREELRFRATYDALTGLSNRGVILEALSREHARRARENGSFGIILIDLDHFKSVNDTYGHACGDEVLKETARRISACVRSYDVVGRYGGEEFLIVVPSSDCANTVGLAERIRAAIEAEPVPFGDQRLRVTASFGAAICSNDRPHELSVMLRVADEALYRAKDLGRNRVEFELPDSGPPALPSPDIVRSGSH